MSWKCFDCFRNQVEDVHLLDYQHCMLYDVPVEVFAYERTLEELKLDANKIRDLPRPLFHCHGLKILSLSDNDIQTLPPAVASLINLQQLDLSRNALSAIPDNIKCCKQLHRVDVSNNPLEKLPEGFTQLINLEELYLNDTCLEFLPANFGRLTRLKILELRENNLNTLPKSIARLSKLERLDLGQNEFLDLPEAVGSLTNLTELWVDCNKIKSISPLIGNLKKLVHFDASNNNISWVSSLIEKCERLVDLTLSCNELQEVPSSIGNLRELITLKLDDNNLRTIPSSIGNLSHLQELILSQNNIGNLPCTIGLLRKLHVLNVDDNVLEDLPPEIGSCSSLALLSLHNNKLQEVPAELGHLAQIKVINLSDNLLRNLPVSILKLTHLHALWLSNNQSTPLTILQKEFDSDTGQTVCVNFLLPQTPQDIILNGQQNECHEAPTRSRTHIRFAVEAIDEEPNLLLRAPTPYPKELRVMAKHAKAIQQGAKRAYKEVCEDAPLLGKMRAPWPSDIQIKEAKVKKPEILPLCEQSKPALFPALSSFETIQDTSRHTAENRPIIREARCIRQRTSASQHSGSKLCDELSCQNNISVSSSTKKEHLRLSISSSLEHPLQPPPYHIAAAYSKQAKWFGHVSPQTRVENWTDNLCYDLVSGSACDNTECSDKHSASSESSEINETLVHKISEITGSENICSWSSQPDGTDTFEENTTREVVENFHTDQGNSAFEENSEYVENVFFGKCLEHVGCVQSEISVSAHFVNNSLSYKNEDLIKLCSSQRSPEMFVDNLQADGDCKALDDYVVIDYETSRKHLPNVHNLNGMFPESCLDEVKMCVDDCDREISGTFHFVEDTVNSNSGNHTDYNIAQSLSCLVLSSPKTGTENDSAYLSPSHNKYTTKFVEKPQVTSDTINYTCSLLQNKIPLEVPFVLPTHDSNHCESHNDTLCSDQFLDTKALNNTGVLGSESGSHVSHDSNILVQNTNFTRSHNIMETSNSVKLQDVQNRKLHYQQSPVVAGLTPKIKSTSIPTSMTGSRGNSKFWRFGQHRNPTVIPISIHKTDELGFGVNRMADMSLLPENQKGIFVVSIDANGPASTLLLPGDKILEVDGTDFSKINYDEAVEILQQTGSVVHMMISRQ